MIFVRAKPVLLFIRGQRASVQVFVIQTNEEKRITLQYFKATFEYCVNNRNVYLWRFIVFVESAFSFYTVYVY